VRFLEGLLGEGVENRWPGIFLYIQKIQADIQMVI
jgi:hypothetical protein